MKIHKVYYCALERKQRLASFGGQGNPSVILVPRLKERGI